ncbi:MAG: rhodanese-like domain-containing protein [Desulforhopalus sp.]
MMKRISHFFLLLPFLLLLSGFFWSDPTWDQVNETIDHKYPSVKNIDVNDLQTSLARGESFILVDVRETEEFAVSHLPSAINIITPAAIKYPKDTAIVVYCSVGVRSAEFAEKLGDLGFSGVRNLRGSIFAWGNKGYPLMRGDTAVHAVHPYNEKWGKLLNPALHRYRVEPEKDR